MEHSVMDIKEREIKQARDKVKYNETIILQKINASHRVAFAEKYPGQIEHILRLLTERLQNGLDKRDNVDIDNVNTWKLLPGELRDISDAVYKIHLVRESIRSNVDNRSTNE